MTQITICNNSIDIRPAHALNQQLSKKMDDMTNFNPELSPPNAYMSHLPNVSHEKQIQGVLNQHCKDLPKQFEIGYNLVIMKANSKPVQLHAGQIRPDGPQNWGSTSKQFTAACIDKLVKQVKISYDSDICTLCPDLPKFTLNGVKQTVTVDHLLHMRSGLPEVWALALLAGVDAEKLTNPELLGLLHKHPGMIFPPGTTQMYCNTNYYLLAKIVENVDVAKRPFIDYVRDEILVPLNMQTRCSIDPSCPKQIPGYEPNPNNPALIEESSSNNRSYGTTGLIGPPSDMVQWNDAVEHRTYDLLEPPKGTSGSPTGLYCRGLIVDRVDDYVKIAHGGALTGAVTIYRRYEHQDPSKTFAFFLATNLGDIGKTEQIANEVANVIAEKELEREEPPKPETPLASCPKEKALRYCGSYTNKEFGTQWVVEAVEKEPGKWAVRMSPANGSDFPRIVFEPKMVDNNLVFQWSFGGNLLRLTQEGFAFGSKNPVVADMSEGVLEPTQEGFEYSPGNMAAVHFTRT